jgi:uncharacterized protein (DUF1810 family)
MTSTRLAEFAAAQDPVYDRVRRELAAGRKETHWIWFIFPQLAALGRSATSKRFGLASKAEAREYFEHPVLGARLKECVGLLLAAPRGEIEAIMGFPDDLKFRSSMTLFAEAAPEEPVFAQALQKFFGGEKDPLTLRLLKS